MNGSLNHSSSQSSGNPFSGPSAHRSLKLAFESESTVLLSGATGTGKTSLAREIHDKSRRRNKPFVVINLATLHEGTLEAELFGRERGAYTGADFKRVGKLELAQGGTVFLDEIGELPLRLQARLLEFLQSRVISPMGCNREVKLDVRIIAATHQQLEKKVREGTFREDLFHRLRVVEIRLPSLSAFSEDFGEILHSTLSKISAELGKSVLRIHPQVADRLEAYSWPGNFRELRNLLEYAVQVCEEGEIRPDDLPEWFMNASLPGAGGAGAALLGVVEFQLGSDFYACMTSVEREYLRRALSQFGGRLNLTARKIGMNKTTLIRRVKELGIHPGNPAEAFA